MTNDQSYLPVLFSTFRSFHLTFPGFCPILGDFQAQNFRVKLVVRLKDMKWAKFVLYRNDWSMVVSNALQLTNALDGVHCHHRRYNYRQSVLTRLHIFLLKSFSFSHYVKLILIKLMPKIVHNQQRFSEIRLLFIVLVVFKPAATAKIRIPNQLFAQSETKTQQIYKLIKCLRMKKLCTNRKTQAATFRWGRACSVHFLEINIKMH